jgi:hypothetical protein
VYGGMARFVVRGLVCRAGRVVGKLLPSMLGARPSWDVAVNLLFVP